MSTFIQEFAKTLLNRYNNDLSNIVVMFPSLRARVFFNDAISTIVDRPIWQPSWSTIDELMERGSGLVRGERIRLISELYKVYKKHHPSEKFDQFYFWGEMLISDFDMIDKYLVDADKLLRNVEDIKEIEADVSYLSETQERILSFWSSIGPEVSLTEQKRHFLKGQHVTAQPDGKQNGQYCLEYIAQHYQRGQRAAKGTVEVGQAGVSAALGADIFMENIL